MATNFDKLKILAVEDEPINLQIIETYINMLGAKSYVARNGLEALGIIEDSEEGFFDAIFIDLKMPMLNGYETAKEIRALDRKDNNIFIAIMSGNSYKEEAENMREFKIDAYLEKPISVEGIKELLEKHF